MFYNVNFLTQFMFSFLIRMVAFCDVTMGHIHQGTRFVQEATVNVSIHHNIKYLLTQILTHFLIYFVSLILVSVYSAVRRLASGLTNLADMP